MEVYYHIHDYLSKQIRSLLPNIYKYTDILAITIKYLILLVKKRCLRDLEEQLFHRVDRLLLNNDILLEIDHVCRQLH